MRLFLSMSAAAFLLAGSGIYHGLVMDRWGGSDDLAAAAEKLEQIPWIVGKWRGHPVEVDERTIRQSEAHGYLARKYVHPEKGAVHVLLLCGRPGPIAVHTPDVCYPGSGYEALDKPKRLTVAVQSAPAEFWSARFINQGAAEHGLQVMWSWKAKDNWSAPARPRIAFGSSRVLYKLYLIRRITESDKSSGNEACLDLLRNLLPEVEACVCSPEIAKPPERMAPFTGG